MADDRRSAETTHTASATCAYPKNPEHDHADCIDGLAQEALEAIRIFREAGGELADLRVSDSSMWLNGFKCIRPSDEFLRDVGRDLIQSAARVPGHTVVRVSIT